MGLPGPGPYESQRDLGCLSISSMPIRTPAKHPNLRYAQESRVPAFGQPRRSFHVKHCMHSAPPRCDDVRWRPRSMIHVQFFCNPPDGVLLTGSLAPQPDRPTTSWRRCQRDRSLAPIPHRWSRARREDRRSPTHTNPKGTQKLGRTPRRCTSRCVSAECGPLLDDRNSVAQLPRFGTSLRPMQHALERTRV